jgi:hypothetical protein
MARLLLAQPTSDNAPAGALFSLWFLLSLFAVVAAILWVLYSRPHRRVPPRRPAPAPGQAGETGPPGHNDPPGREDPGAGG